MLMDEGGAKDSPRSGTRGALLGRAHSYNGINIPSIVTPADTSILDPTPAYSPRDPAEKQRKDEELRILHKLIEQKRLEKVKRESIGRERSRTQEEAKMEALRNMQLENEIKKAEQKEEALFLMRDAEEREAEGAEAPGEILEGTPVDINPEISPSPELIEEARREGAPFKPTHTRSSYSLLPSPLNIARSPLAITIPAMLAKPANVSPPLPPRNSPTRSPPSHPPPSPPLTRAVSPPTSPTSAPTTQPFGTLTVDTTSQSTSPPNTPQLSSTPTTPTLTPDSPPQDANVAPDSPPNTPTTPTPPHRIKHQKQNSVSELPILEDANPEPVLSAVELLKEQLAEIEAIIKQRETRIKAKEKEIEQLKILAKKHPQKCSAKHLEICIVFDVSASWVDKFVASVTDLILELKTLYEYTINISLVECGGAKRYIDFYAISEPAKLHEFISGVKRTKGEGVNVIDYCVALSRVASLSWSNPPWTRLLLFFTGGAATTVIPDSDERLRDVMPLIKALNLSFSFIRMLGKGDMAPLEKYLRHYNDLEKGLMTSELRDGPSMVNDLVKKAIGRAQRRETYLLSPPEQLIHRLMTWEIIEPIVVPGEQLKTQSRRIFCKRWNFPFRSFTDFIYTIKSTLWNSRDSNGVLCPAPPAECVRVPARFDVYAASDSKSSTNRFMEIKNFKKQDVKFVVRQFKVKDQAGVDVPAEDFYYYTMMDMNLTATYFSIEFNFHMAALYPGISPLYFTDSFVVVAPQNVPGSNIFLAEQHFPKYNVVRTLSPERDAYVQAFSHFTYCASGGLILVDSLCWIQESNMYAKYAMHTPTVKERFQLPSNEGEAGITKFFEKHLCNDMCIALKLKRHPSQPNSRRSLAQDFTQRLVPKPPLSPSASTTNLRNPVRIEKNSSNSFRSTGNLLSGSGGVSASGTPAGIGAQSYFFTWNVDIVMGMSTDKIYAPGSATWEESTDAALLNGDVSPPPAEQPTNGKTKSSRFTPPAGGIVDPSQPQPQSQSKSPGLFSQVTKFLSGGERKGSNEHPYKQNYQQQIQNYHEEQLRQQQGEKNPPSPPSPKGPDFKSLPSSRPPPRQLSASYPPPNNSSPSNSPNASPQSSPQTNSPLSQSFQSSPNSSPQSSPSNSSPLGQSFMSPKTSTPPNSSPLAQSYPPPKTSTPPSTSPISQPSPALVTSPPAQMLLEPPSHPPPLPPTGDQKQPRPARPPDQPQLQTSKSSPHASQTTPPSPKKNALSSSFPGNRSKT